MATQAQTARVRFHHTRQVWETVVTDSACKGEVTEERTTYFIMEYSSRELFEEELARFGGLIDSQVLDQNGNKANS